MSRMLMESKRLLLRQETPLGYGGFRVAPEVKISQIRVVTSMNSLGSYYRIRSNMHFHKIIFMECSKNTVQNGNGFDRQFVFSSLNRSQRGCCHVRQRGEESSASRDDVRYTDGKRAQEDGGNHDANQGKLLEIFQHKPRLSASLRMLSQLERLSESVSVRLAFQAFQFVASLAFVGLYIWSTYSVPPRNSWRYFAEVFLCLIFALEYLHRLIAEHPDLQSRIRMVTSFRNIVDLLSWGPPLVEFVLLPFLPSLPSAIHPFQRLDLRWFKLLRTMRVARIGLLGAELRSLHLSTKRGSWLSAGTNFRLAQLTTSVITLLFVATAIFQLLEGMPFHRAFYFTMTTLSTVGSDVVPVSFLGRAAVLGMIAVGIVLIPVQAAAFYTELSARRVIRGSLPAVMGRPFILLSARLTEVRAFSDFYSEFRQALSSSSATLPRNSRLAVLCNRPTFEFVTFQELHERGITLIEGSAVSAQDLVRVKAERAGAIMLMADRFTTDPEAEDLGVLFQVWTCKSYTKLAPLFIQTVRQSSVSQIEPFLDPERDVVISVEAARFRLLALSTVCPGSGTLIGNLLRSSKVTDTRENQDSDEMLGGRRWFREYVNGCAYRIIRHTKTMPKHLVGRKFIDVAEWMFRETNLVLIGITWHHGIVKINPSDHVFSGKEHLLVLAPDERSVLNALEMKFSEITFQEGLRLKDLFVPLLKEDKRIAEFEEPTQEDYRALGLDCMPLIYGNPDSESIEADDMPCVPWDLWEKYQKQTSSENLRNLNAKLGNNIPASDSSPLLQNFSNGISNTEDSQPSLETQFSSQPEGLGRNTQFSGHFIVCGHGGSIIPFLSFLRTAEPDSSVPIVILAPVMPSDFDAANEVLGPLYYISGSPSETSTLRAAGAATARALVFLARGSRPVKSAQATGSGIEQERGAREAVLADASALLTCYGAAEESGAALTHAVVELLFTTSVEFLQPGLLLKGNLNRETRNHENDVDQVRSPRKSWLLRANMMQAAVEEGLAEWQASPYVAAGRVTVPALLDAYACQCFFSQGLISEILRELCGELSLSKDEYLGKTRQEPTLAENEANDNGDHFPGGALLRQVPVPQGMIGRSYGELFAAMALISNNICLGLYRRKRETIGSKLSYVATNPRWDTVLQKRDCVFVLVPRPR